jgi:hypothetical protein
MKRKFLILAGIYMAVGFSISVPAMADTILDTTGDGTVKAMYGGFGYPNMATVGETFTAPDSQLNSFSMYLYDCSNPNGGACGTLNLRG